MTAAPASRTSVIEHLQAMPDVFDLGLFVLATGVARASAKVMLSRWASKGYIELAGPKSGIYFKRLGALLDHSEQVEAGVLHLYPSATICGATVLHRAGWITQIPHDFHVAIEGRPSAVQINGVTLHQRPLLWFQTVHEQSGFAPDSHASLQSMRKLRPHWALADMMTFRDGWVPDEDDLEFPDPKAEDAVAHAMQALKTAAQERIAPARPRKR
ncbi:hypothetical protein [Hydrogenophaga sp.]|uniref:hypothetical protein n=1 Tax=Hydrogenophaga sp. TaxID=1904254 RepID=UPI002721B76D|nr:hypothetical protein [Hydrogenophaga sp.]MDO9435753.1 hypothetical protein [Hydrogenophaga sp.]